MSGLYVHIPFCESRCIYCGFYSTTEKNLQTRYVDALLKELELRKDYLAEPLQTIYFGGGTPSTLSADNLARLVRGIEERIDTSHVTEWTMECNPDDIYEHGDTETQSSFVDAIAALPINRVSMGAQTFDDDLLRWLHRRHTSSQVKDAVNRLRAADINNISIDLMFGFPQQFHNFFAHGVRPHERSIPQLRGFESDIEEVLKLEPEHISAYSLMYEDGTPLGRMLKEGRVTEIDEEVSRRMYEMLIDRLTAAGYEHYEISNFAKPGYRSRHNSSYWNQTPYMGLGAAAHSYNRCARSWNVSDLHEYIKGIESIEGRECIERDLLPQEVEVLDDNTRYNDLVTTALRTKEGIDLSSLSPKYRDYLLKEAGMSLKNNLLAITQNHIHLTRKGLFVSDSVMSDLVYI